MGRLFRRRHCRVVLRKLGMCRLGVQVLEELGLSAVVAVVLVLGLVLRRWLSRLKALVLLEVRMQVPQPQRLLLLRSDVEASVPMMMMTS